jgi:fermentation-respiration switch protein FrsA (DUF1100 family)
MKKTAFTTIFFLISLFLLPRVCQGGTFPPELTNEGRAAVQVPKASPDMVRETVKYQYAGKTVEGLVVYPAKTEKKKIPSVLFLQTPDETPSLQLGRMEALARKGYLVMCVPWANHGDALKAYQELEKHGKADDTALTVMGAHEGGTQAILLGCQLQRSVKAVVSVSAHPPYDMPGGDPAGTIWAPVLLVHGEADTQTPSSVSRYFYFNLQDRGRAAEIFVLPFSSHFFNDSEWAQVMIEVDLFLKKYVTGIPEDKKFNIQDIRRPVDK